MIRENPNMTVTLLVEEPQSLTSEIDFPFRLSTSFQPPASSRGRPGFRPGTSQPGVKGMFFGGMYAMSLFLTATVAVDGNFKLQSDKTLGQVAGGSKVLMVSNFAMPAVPTALLVSAFLDEPT
jgi:hypothetical protein